IMPVTAPSYSSTALVPIVVPCNTWSIVVRGNLVRSHNSAMPATTPRDGSSGVVGTLWITVCPVSVSAKTMSVNVPPTSTPISRIAASHCFAGVGAAPRPSIAHDRDDRKGGADHDKRQAGGHRAERVDHRRRRVGLHRFQFERQGIERTDRL